MSADCNSPREVHLRTVIVLCKGRNIFLNFAADSNKPVKARPRTVTDAYHCPRTHFYEVWLYLPAKVIGLAQDR